MIAVREEKATEPTGIERRVWIRYGSDLEAVCRAPTLRQESGWMARVTDVSRGGVGLVSRHRFRAGTPLLIEVRDHSGDMRLLAAKVVHARPIDDNGHPGWLMGCVFGLMLSETELQALR
jgi:PilZ domain